jgi:hypothetical protein
LQITPPSFSNREQQSLRLFEALYPKLTGPEDTRHFVEEVQENEAMFQIADECRHEDTFKDF